MSNWIRDIFYGVRRDKHFNRHKSNCLLHDSTFTVIKNNDKGRAVWKCQVKYCPCCGEKLNGK